MTAPNRLAIVSALAAVAEKETPGARLVLAAAGLFSSEKPDTISATNTITQTAR